MKPEFFEDLISVHADPMDSRTIDFPWEEVLARLDNEVQNRPELIEQFAAGLEEIVGWLVKDIRGTLKIETVVARRAIAMAWVLRPQVFEGAPSLTKLSERLGIPLEKLSQQTVKFSRRFGVHNRMQARYSRNYQASQVSNQRPTH